jgi:hypothetical protein
MSENFNGMPIETPEAIRAWASKRKDNRAIRLVAFSKDEQDFKRLAKQYGWKRGWRDRVWAGFNQWVNQPDMVNVPFFLGGRYYDNIPPYLDQ